MLAALISRNSAADEKEYLYRDYIRLELVSHFFFLFVQRRDVDGLI